MLEAGREQNLKFSKIKTQMTPFGEIYALSSADSQSIKNNEEMEDSYCEPASFD